MTRPPRGPYGRRRSEPFVRGEPAFTLVPVQPVEEETEDTLPGNVLGPLPVSAGPRLIDEDRAAIAEAQDEEQAAIAETRHRVQVAIDEGEEQVQKQRRIVAARLESIAFVLRDMQIRWEPNT